MDNVKTSWWDSHRPTKRRLIQLYCALLYNAHVKGFLEGEIYKSKNPTTKGICAPGLNCYSCPGAVGACPLGALQNAIGTSGQQIGFYVYGIIMLYGLLLGRTICGWLCPFGLIQELLHKLPTPKIRKSRVTRALSYLKYLLLAVFAAGVTAWYGIAHGVALPGFCKYICPAGTFEGAVFLLSNPKNAGDFSMLNILFTRKFVIMLFIGLLCVFCYRSFCRFLCPLGAIYGFFCRLAVVGVKVDVNRCNRCGSCVRSCPMDVRHVGDHECIHCTKCMDVCSRNALSLKAGRFTLKAPACGCAGDTPESGARRVKIKKNARVLALAVLCAALLWYNILDPNIKKAAGASPVEPAAETAAGEALPDGTADGGTDAGTAIAGGTDAETAIANGTDTGTAITGGTDGESFSSENLKPGAAPAPSQETETAEAIEEKTDEDYYSSDAPLGCEEGEQLPDFSITCLDGTGFHLADYRGKPVFINLWATYCGPCVKELPFFSELCEEHNDDIAVLALHSDIVVEDVGKYLEDFGSDWVMPFAVENEDEKIWTLVGGTTSMPQTIVLNRYGEVVYNRRGSVTPEMLAALYEQASR